jgi:two-component system, OmpR family, sensor histidine kinase SenX3
VAIAVALLTLLAGALTLAWWRQRRRAAGLADAIDRTLGAMGYSARPDRADFALLTAVGRVTDRAEIAESDGRRLAGMVEQADFGIMALDAEGEVAYANPRAQRYLRARHGDAVAEAQLRSLAAEVNERRAEQRREVEVYTPTRRVIGLHAVPLEADGLPAGVAVFLEDLTDRRRVDAIRKDFVANASHELKTPLGALSVLAETLADADDPDTRRRLAERLATETRRMSRLIDDILDLALVETTAGDLATLAVDEVVADAVKQVSVIAEEYGVPIESSAAGLDVLVAGDHRQLVSAVSNLLENAVKYTHASGEDPGAPVKVRAIADAGAAVIEVEDRGPGISEQHLERIFERFYRVDRARSRQTGGTGLGLAIVRHIVLNHQGSVDVESSPGVGSTFRVRLPLAKG